MEEIFKDNPCVKVPKIYPRLSTSCLITMSYETGVFLTNMKGIEELGLKHSDIVKLLFEAYSKQMFESGFVHCDPHSVHFL
jgi:predicted unusual protein kinase regulating ubiquinone biosynthesis (AarF/ABC1/UbiB family)